MFAYACVCASPCNRAVSLGKSRKKKKKRGGPIIILKPSLPMTFLHLLCVLLHSISKGQPWTWAPCKKLYLQIYRLFFSFFFLNASCVLCLHKWILIARVHKHSGASCARGCSGFGAGVRGCDANDGKHVFGASFFFLFSRSSR